MDSHFTSVNAESEPCGDPVTIKVLMGGRAPERPVSAERPLDRTLLSRNHVSARLAEMDAQLAALQSIADHMDLEFASTRVVSCVSFNLRLMSLFYEQSSVFCRFLLC